MSKVQEYRVANLAIFWPRICYVIAVLQVTNLLLIAALELVQNETFWQIFQILWFLENGDGRTYFWIWELQFVIEEWWRRTVFFLAVSGLRNNDDDHGSSTLFWRKRQKSYAIFPIWPQVARLPNSYWRIRWPLHLTAIFRSLDKDDNLEFKSCPCMMHTAAKL